MGTIVAMAKERTTTVLFDQRVLRWIPGSRELATAIMTRGTEKIGTISLGFLPRRVEA
jgi:hypothetical protein